MRKVGTKIKESLADAINQYEHSNKLNPNLVSKYKRMYEWIELARIYNNNIPLKEHIVSAEKYENMKLEEDEHLICWNM